MALESPSRQTSGHACEGNFWLWLSVGGTISWAGVLDSRRRQAEHHSSYFASWLEMQCTAASHSCYRASPALLDWTPLHCWLYRHSLLKLLLGRCLVIAKAKATDTAWKEVFLSFKWDITFDYEIDSTNNDIDIVLESHRLLHCLTSWLSDAHFLSPPRYPEATSLCSVLLSLHLYPKLMCDFGIGCGFVKICWMQSPTF